MLTCLLKLYFCLYVLKQYKHCNSDIYCIIVYLFTVYKDGYFYVSYQHNALGESHLNASRQIKKTFNDKGILIKEENLPNYLWTTNIKSLDIKYNYN